MFDVEQIRKEFPLLSCEVYGRRLVYLDSGATAQKPEVVIRAVDRLHRELNANIHRGVHYLSEQATEAYEAAREEVARFIRAGSKEEIIFTAGATASINLVAYAWSERFLQAGDNILISELEHHSNIVPWQLAAERKGAEIRVLPFDDAGNLMVEKLPELLDERTKLVAVTEASNTLGTRPDLRVLIDAAHAVGAVAVVDGCQGVVHGGVDVAALGCDFYCFSGHKLYAPTGIGVLYGRREVLEQMPPFMSGGDMVDRQRTMCSRSAASVLLRIWICSSLKSSSTIRSRSCLSDSSRKTIPFLTALSIRYRSSRHTTVQTSASSRA